VCIGCVTESPAWHERVSHILLEYLETTKVDPRATKGCCNGRERDSQRLIEQRWNYKPLVKVKKTEPIDQTRHAREAAV